MRAYERLMKYIMFDTTSRESCPNCPSSEGQLVFGRALVEEMKALGINDAHQDEHGYIYGTVAANVPGQPVIGLIAHMDTVDDAPASPMKAHIISNYQGGDITMNESGSPVLSPAVYPHLNACIGQDLLITDGHTLLGADDKAGIAEILTLVEELNAHPDIKHGDIRIGFTPDEEIGRGADLFDVPGFGADFAYTMDGGAFPCVEYENFNAASASVVINGVNIHPGGAKNMMKNAMLIACEFNAMLPAFETPAHTQGREGFYHLTEMSGLVEKAALHYIIRDHDKTVFAARKDTVRRIADYLKEKYGAGTVELEIKDSYYNMLDVIKEHMDVVERARYALRKTGYEPIDTPIRGGTDGARLSFMGLPCPNLPTGGENYHSRFEYIPLQAMDDAVTMLRHIVEAR